MGMGEIDTDTIGHDKLVILGTNQLFLSKKITNWDSSPNVTPQIITFAQFSGFKRNLVVFILIIMEYSAKHF